MGGRARRDPGTPPDPAEHARSIALRLLDHAPRSAAALRDKLVSRGVDVSLAEQLVERFREVGLIDDASLAATVARSRHVDRGHARRAISQELRRKGFGADDVVAALEGVSSEDEALAAEALVRKRWATLAALPAEVRARRIVGALGRRGYSPAVAFALVRRFERADIWDNRVREAELAEEE